MAATAGETLALLHNVLIVVPLIQKLPGFVPIGPNAFLVCSLYTFRLPRGAVAHVTSERPLSRPTPLFAISRTPR